MTKKEFYLKACLVFAQDFASAYSTSDECDNNNIYFEACNAAADLTAYAEHGWNDMSRFNGLVWDED